VACGARTGLPSPGDLVGGSSGAGDGSCTGVELPLELNAPNLYFVLDASGSMKTDSKWTNWRQVVGELITQLGPQARFGASVCPAPSGSVCAAGTQVMPLTAGDAQGHTASAFLTATASIMPNGGTPTAPTLQGLVPELGAERQPTFVILATDGGPN